ncbi:MAG TPA: ABC transporter permease subunit [Steroidobacteraceae bacterium]
MRAILVIAHLTWVEARRRRVVLAALLGALLLTAVFAIVAASVGHAQQHAVGLQRQIQLQTLALAGLYAADFLIVALAIMLPVDTLSGEIYTGILQTVVAKPIRRADVILGKSLAYWLMIVGYSAVLFAGILISMRLGTGFVQHRALPAFGLLQLEALVLLSITIAGGVFFSTITNGIVAFAFYTLAYIGGWIELVGTSFGNSTARHVGIAISLASPTDALWRLALHILQPPVMSQIALNPFAGGVTPSPAMVWWAAGFVLVVFGLALRAFEKKAL